MLSREWDTLQPVASSRAKARRLAVPILPACIQVVRTYWWWVPLLLLSMLAGGAVASHHSEKPPTEAKPTLLVERDSTPLARPT